MTVEEAKEIFNEVIVEQLGKILTEINDRPGLYTGEQVRQVASKCSEICSILGVDNSLEDTE